LHWPPGREGQSPICFEEISMRRLFADRLVLFTAAIVVAMAALFAYSRVMG
jgi:hypothetical protein